jgi:hypothetical protein
MDCRAMRCMARNDNVVKVVSFFFSLVFFSLACYPMLGYPRADVALANPVRGESQQP